MIFNMHECLQMLNTAKYTRVDNKTGGHVLFDITHPLCHDYFQLSKAIFAHGHPIVLEGSCLEDNRLQ